MKNYFITGLMIVTFLSGCGKQSESNPQDLLQQSNNAAPVTDTSSCPLYFASENLCAQINWMTGPSTETESSFEVLFWKKGAGSATGPLVQPLSQVGSYIRMTCCGSISFPKINKISDGKYAITKVRFVPGNWEVYVQLKEGEKVEKQFVTVKLDE